MTARIDSKDLDLRVVPATRVLLHEETDPERVSRLRSALQNDGFLRNPPIVAEANGDYVVLDGATRTTALRSLGCRDIVVQVVPYAPDRTGLEAWYHLLPHVAARHVIDGLEALPDVGVSVTTLDDAEQQLARRSAAAAIVVDSSTAHVLTVSESIPATLRALVKLYGGFGEVFRIVHEDLQRVVRSQTDVEAVVLFPAWKPDDIISAARAGDLLPAGITRHVIPGRVLNLGISLDMLQIEASETAKQTWLEGWLTRKILARKVRFYHESVFMFDD